jgi:hypothetical protein
VRGNTEFRQCDRAGARSLRPVALPSEGAPAYVRLAALRRAKGFTPCKQRTASRGRIAMLERRGDMTYRKSEAIATARQIGAWKLGRGSRGLVLGCARLAVSVRSACLAPDRRSLVHKMGPSFRRASQQLLKRSRPQGAVAKNCPRDTFFCPPNCPVTPSAGNSRVGPNSQRNPGPNSAISTSSSRQHLRLGARRPSRACVAVTTAPHRGPRKTFATQPLRVTQHSPASTQQRATNSGQQLR